MIEKKKVTVPKSDILEQPRLFLFSFFFFPFFFFNFGSCAAQQPSNADFYEGLKKRQEGAQSVAAACFEKALNNANDTLAAAAAAELLGMRAAGTMLSDAAMIAVRRKAAETGGSWARALEALEGAEAADKEQLLSLLLNGDSRALDDAARYALGRWRAMMDEPAGATDGADTGGGTPPAIPLTEAETALISGRVAVSLSRYGEALLFFRIALRDSPDLFFHYPDLLTDLGRTFQYTSTGREGIELFLNWEKTLAVPPENENLVRFRLLFFAARIAKQRGLAEENIALFERALPFALRVSPEQSDACIWYILDSSLAQGTDAATRYLEKYISQWSDDAYFSDVMDKLARELILKQQWEDIDTVRSILSSRSSGGHSCPAHAKYAWIISRLLEEGLYTPKKTTPSSPAEYRRIAYDAGLGSLYYRSLSAAALGEPFLTPAAAEAAQVQKTPPRTGRTARSTRTAKTASVEATAIGTTASPTMEFLLGFFRYNAAVFAPRYIRPLENDLSAGELRLLASALGETGQYQESIRLVSLYSRRSGYQMTRQDWELLYPCPFKEPVERYAEETGISPALLFALIRTESAFDHTVVSRAGAVGLTQLMPPTAQEMAARIHRRGGPNYLSGDEEAPNLRDPAVNIHIGAVYLAYLEERMEDPLLALLAYNGGINRIRRWRRAGNSAAALPPDLFLETVEYAETRNYGRSVMGAAAMYTELYYSNLVQTEINR